MEAFAEAVAIHLGVGYSEAQKVAALAYIEEVSLVIPTQAAHSLNSTHALALSMHGFSVSTVHIVLQEQRLYTLVAVVSPATDIFSLSLSLSL